MCVAGLCGEVVDLFLFSSLGIGVAWRKSSDAGLEILKTSNVLRSRG